MSDYYIDRRLSQIRDQYHIHYYWRMYRTKVKICWFQFIVYLKIFEAFPQLCIQVKSVTVTMLSLAVYYLCVIFNSLNLMGIWQEKFMPKTAFESKNAIKKIKSTTGNHYSIEVWQLLLFAFYLLVLFHKNTKIDWAIIIAEIYIWWYCSSCSDSRQAGWINGVHWSE